MQPDPAYALALAAITQTHAPAYAEQARDLDWPIWRGAVLAARMAATPSTGALASEPEPRSFSDNIISAGGEHAPVSGANEVAGNFVQCASCPYMIPAQFDRCPICPEQIAAARMAVEKEPSDG
jgi:hypothetical protein